MAAAAYWTLLPAFGEAEAEDLADGIVCDKWKGILSNERLAVWVYSTERTQRPSSYVYRCGVNAAIDVLRGTKKARAIPHIPIAVQIASRRGGEDGVAVTVDFPTQGALSVEQELILQQEFTVFERELLERAMTCAEAGIEIGKSTTAAFTLRRRCRDRLRSMAPILRLKR